MKNSNEIVQIAIMSFFTLTTVMATTHVEAASNPQAAAASSQMEKCYGIVKKGMNDCQTNTAACAGSATKDSQKDAFIFLPEGTCNKIVGGSLVSNAKK